MNPMHDDSDWLTSAVARKILKASTCELAHLREAGKIRFVKRGNAFLYAKSDCQRIAELGRDNSTATCAIPRSNDRELA
jgi:hypothetical protein